MRHAIKCRMYLVKNVSAHVFVQSLMKKINYTRIWLSKIDRQNVTHIAQVISLRIFDLSILFSFQRSLVEKSMNYRCFDFLAFSCYNTFCFLIVNDILIYLNRAVIGHNVRVNTFTKNSPAIPHFPCHDS